LNKKFKNYPFTIQTFNTNCISGRILKEYINLKLGKPNAGVKKLDAGVENQPIAVSNQPST
jgi:hypothetical protein